MARNTRDVFYPWGAFIALDIIEIQIYQNTRVTDSCYAAVVSPSQSCISTRATCDYEQPLSPVWYVPANWDVPKVMQALERLLPDGVDINSWN